MRRQRTKYNSIQHIEQQILKLLHTDYYIGGTFVNKVNVNLYEDGWRFEWGTFKQSFGRTIVRRRGGKTIAKIIRLSKPIVSQNLEQGHFVNNTMLHELAHAIQYEWYKELNHGKDWKQIFLDIGGNGEVFYDAKKVNPALPKYTLICEHCKITQGIHRLPKHAQSCGHCSPGVWDEKYQLLIQVNY